MAALLASVCVAGLAALPASAGSTSIALPNGAQLNVSIDDPVAGDILGPSASLDVAVVGTASVGLGEPDATFIYAIDVSGSASSGGGTGCAPILDW